MTLQLDSYSPACSSFCKVVSACFSWQSVGSHIQEQETSSWASPANASSSSVAYGAWGQRDCGPWSWRLAAAAYSLPGVVWTASSLRVKRSGEDQIEGNRQWYDRNELHVGGGEPGVLPSLVRARSIRVAPPCTSSLLLSSSSSRSVTNTSFDLFDNTAKMSDDEERVTMPFKFVTGASILSLVLSSTDR